MIVSLIVITLAFVWLLYESDWLRIRLIVGPLYKSPSLENLLVPFKCEGQTYNSFQPDIEPIKLFQRTGNPAPDKSYQDYGISRGNGCWNPMNDLIFSPGIKEPICGWDWLLKREHPPVNYEFTIIAHGCKHTIRLNSDAHRGKIIQQVSETAFRKISHNGHKPRRIKTKGRTFGNPADVKL